MIMDSVDLKSYGIGTVLDQDSPKNALFKIAKESGLLAESREFAKHLDSLDKLGHLRQLFEIPLIKDLPCSKKEKYDGEEECLYFCGNSLGLKPKKADVYLNEVAKDWGRTAVFMHFNGLYPAALCDMYPKPLLVKIIGAAKESEVAVMNGLTVNLHLLMVSFYRPTEKKYKIVIEDHAFPSDRYAVVSQMKLHNVNPNDGLITCKPRKGEEIIRTEDILRVLEEEGDSVALVMLSGVQYYTGQKFDIKVITEAAKTKGCIVGWDLAHAIGNVKLALHEWNVDFATWCSYKYLNSGAGGISGIFVHELHHGKNHHPQLLGWWSNAQSTRFEMRKEVDIAEGADSFRLCNPPPLLVAPHMASLEIFDQAPESERMAKQYLLTGYLEWLISFLLKDEVKIITPAIPRERGCQLSFVFKRDLKEVHKELESRGIVCDVRLPSVMRIAPTPLYNKYEEVYRFVIILKEVLEAES
ncbi:kynureninase-like [Artemia franciscana]|uniref:kynureninase-like n=1 Tax=Artemia franciscana TaxID=6661 RepID=UPI0032DB80A6